MILSGKIIIDYIRHYFNCSENEARSVLEELPSDLNNYYEIFKEIFPGFHSFREINREDKEMAHYLRENFRRQIDFCQRIGLITISEWSFLYRAADII